MREAVSAWAYDWPSSFFRVPLRTYRTTLTVAQLRSRPAHSDDKMSADFGRFQNFNFVTSRQSSRDWSTDGNG